MEPNIDMDLMARLANEHDVCRLVGRPVAVFSADGWAYVGRFVAPTREHMVLCEVSRVAMDGRHSALMRGEILKEAEIEAYPPASRAWIPWGGAVIVEWSGELPVATQ